MGENSTRKRFRRGEHVDVAL